MNPLQGFGSSLPGCSIIIYTLRGKPVEVNRARIASKMNPSSGKLAGVIGIRITVTFVESYMPVGHKVLKLVKVTPAPQSCRD
jgi:hypothetical protein